METVPFNLSEFLRRHQSRDVRKKDDEGRVWELEGIGSSVDTVRDALLGHILATAPSLVIAYDEEAPTEAELLPHVTATGPAQFSVHTCPPVRSLRKWLYLGNWQMFSHRPASFKDLARAMAQDVA